MVIARETDVFDSAEDFVIWKRVKDYTMTSAERVSNLLKAVDYIVRSDIPGEFVECGVWRGGSAMAIALKLQNLGVKDRAIHLYDTFSGMTDPTNFDEIISSGDSASTLLNQANRNLIKQRFTRDVRAIALREEVEDNLRMIDYPFKNFHFVEGPVETTLSSGFSKPICLLRLDTDFYESTRIELEVLFPRLVTAGILIVDDYGHWLGARKAVDEYFQHHKTKIFLHKVDYTGRFAVKC
jgi:hypothetical protein